MIQTGELNPEALFKQLSLKELSIAASDLSTTLLQTTDDEEFPGLTQLSQYECKHNTIVLGSVKVTKKLIA